MSPGRRRETRTPDTRAANVVRHLPYLLAAGVALALAAGCKREQPAPAPAAVADPVPPAPDVNAPPPARTAASPFDKVREIRGTVIQATDAGTLLVRPSGESRLVTVRLIGLAPPVKATRDKDGQEPWATRGQQALAVQLVRKDVRVEFDVVRAELGLPGVWGYVWLPAGGAEVLVNETVLAEGHAVLETRVPNVKYVERLGAAQRAAREAGKNIWSATEPLPESPAEYAKKLAEGKSAAPTLAAWEEGCLIGNSKSKKYHAPGGQYYAASRTSEHAVFFKTEADARAAGYDKASR